MVGWRKRKSFKKAKLTIKPTIIKSQTPVISGIETVFAFDDGIIKSWDTDGTVLAHQMKKSGFGEKSG